MPQKGLPCGGLGAQADRKLYKAAMQEALLAQKNLTIVESGAEDIIVKEDQGVSAVVLASGEVLSTRCVVLTTGTFLRGIIHRGETQIPAGRVGEAPSVGLALTLEKLGLPFGSPENRNTGSARRADYQLEHFGRTKG
jgi:tRNA uridine 5-carboxymethylaminomethyl modification enzyme